MRKRMLSVAAVAVAFALLGGTVPAVAAEPTIWLHVEVNDEGGVGPRVKVHLPLSLIEVVIDSLDTGEVMREIRIEKGIDLGRLWRELRSADLDEFVTMEVDGARVKVFKDRQSLRMTVQERGYAEPNIRVRIPFAVMDILTEAEKGEFRLSELVRAVRGELPLVLVEADRDEGSVRVWIDEEDED